MLKNIVLKLMLLMGCLFCTSIAFASGPWNCSDCYKNSFGHWVCNQGQQNCKCFCAAKPDGSACAAFNLCLSGDCVTAPEPTVEQTITYTATHSWINDANLVNDVRLYSVPIAEALKVIKSLNKGEKYSEASGGLNYDGGSATFELIERTDGTDEIRTSEDTKPSETLMFITSKKKWFLFKSVANASHINHKELEAEGVIQ